MWATVVDARVSVDREVHATAGREAGATPGLLLSCLVVSLRFVDGYFHLLSPGARVRGGVKAMVGRTG